MTKSKIHHKIVKYEPPDSACDRIAIIFYYPRITNNIDDTKDLKITTNLHRQTDERLESDEIRIGMSFVVAVDQQCFKPMFFSLVENQASLPPPP